MPSSNTVVIQTNGGNQTQNASPSPLSIHSGDSVTFSNSNSGNSPNSIQIVFPVGITCTLSNGRQVSTVPLQANGSITVSLQAPASESPRNYTVNTQWQTDVKTISPVIIIE